MPFPLIPIAIGAGAAGLGLGAATKKSGSLITGVQHAPQEVYSPTDARAFNITLPDTNVIYDSPLSSISTKKTLSAEASPVGPTSGTDMSTLAVIGAAGLIVYGLVNRK